MPNPLFGNATSPNGATAPNDSLNNSVKRYKRGYNKFNLTRQFYNTERYADINLVDVIEGVEGDKLPIANKHEIRTYTLKSPIMFDVYKKKTYFMVDNKAILPINWEKVYKQPNKGDDVDISVNCVSKYFFRHVFSFLDSRLTQVRSSYDSYEPEEIEERKETLNMLFRYFLFLESTFSNGSLLASMNCHLSPLIRVTDSNGYIIYKSFDIFLQEVYSKILDEYNLTVHFPQLSSEAFRVHPENPMDQDNRFHYVTRQQMLDMLRTFPDFVVTYGENTGDSLTNYLFDSLSRLRFNYEFGTGDIEDDTINFSRLVAYQLICTQFYTNDSVDNIYTAELFMQNAKAILKRAITSTSQTFLYNGVQTEYDVFSGHFIDDVLKEFFYIPGIEGNFFEAYNYLHMLFFYRKSLRYGDYFVGAKTLPFAPGDVTADVVGNGVSALDITRKILMQRFLNSVERARNTWKDYLKDVTDGVAAPNPLEPRFLASSTSRVNGFEVENTAENQGNIVTLLKSGNSNYVYEVEVGSPCIIIGVSTYEVPRVYSQTLDRFFKHRDRFDMFNKFMQNIGDQDISLAERSVAFKWSRIFGYTPRHMEYKQRYPIASGGFVENLSGYAFITDNYQSNQNELDFSDSALKISPYYIRNRNSEFDRFYSSLTGLTLASYFHFIVKYDNICHAARQMEYSPTIL